jgi:hypothetical protein
VLGQSIGEMTPVGLQLSWCGEDLLDALKQGVWTGLDMEASDLNHVVTIAHAGGAIEGWVISPPVGASAEQIHR